MKNLLLPLFIIFLLLAPITQVRTETVLKPMDQDVTISEKMIGIDANYVNDMKDIPFFTWRIHSQRIDPYSYFPETGVDSFRLRVFAKDNGSFGLHYAIKTARDVQQHGMKPYMVLFLSSDWADFGKQPAPESWITEYDWGNLSLEQKGNIVYDYTRDTVTQFLENDVDIDLYEIGNEIDFGICGIFEDDVEKRENISYMKQSTWKNMSFIINKAIDGVKSVDSSSQFLLHITHWWDYNFSKEFFQYMIDSGVPLDYLGFSFYPSSGIYNLTEILQGKGNGTRSHQLFKETMRNVYDTLQKNIIICEFAYPSSNIILGPFSWFNHEVDGYPLTKDGQNKWVTDFLTWCYQEISIKGMFYFSPEFYVFIWSPLSFFSYFGSAKPALEAYRPYDTV